MIKPVYFGNSKEDKFLFEFINGLKDFNFSDWVKNKVCEEFDIKIVVGADYKNISSKPISTPPNPPKDEEEKVNIDTERNKIDQFMI